MESKEATNTSASGRTSRLLRYLAFGSLLLLFVVCSIGAYLAVVSLNATRESVVDPVGELVRQLAIEVTPEIIPDRTIIVEEVSELARLETASMTMNQVFEADRNSDFLWGAFGEELTFLAFGEVVAGVDLAKLGQNDVQVVDPDTVMIHLPPAEIFNRNTILDTERSYIVHRDEGIFTEADPELETAVRRRAQTELLNAALERGILELADENARSYMTEFLNGLGFEEVIFTDAPPPPAPPYEQDVPKGFAVTPVSP